MLTKICAGDILQNRYVTYLIISVDRFESARQILAFRKDKATLYQTFLTLKSFNFGNFKLISRIYEE